MVNEGQRVKSSRLMTAYGPRNGLKVEIAILINQNERNRDMESYEQGCEETDAQY